MMTLKGSVYEKHPWLLFQPWCWWDIYLGTLITAPYVVASTIASRGAPYLMRHLMQGFDPRYDE
jgi:hypothetical protein